MLKNIIICLTFISTFAKEFGQTRSELKAAVDSCLQESPTDGICTTFGTDSEYGTMPNWDVSQVTNMDAIQLDSVLACL